MTSPKSIHPKLQESTTSKQNPLPRRNFFQKIAKNIHVTLCEDGQQEFHENTPYTHHPQSTEKEEVFFVFTHQKDNSWWAKKGSLFQAKTTHLAHLLPHIPKLLQKHNLSDKKTPHLVTEASQISYLPTKHLSVFNKLFFLTPTLPTIEEAKNLTIPTLLVIEADPKKPADDLLALAPHLPEGSDVFTVPPGSLNPAQNPILAKRLTDFLNV